MRIQHNIPAMNSYRNYNNNNKKLGRNLEKLSSGYAINRAGDDAAGLAISEKMRAQITGVEIAAKNAKDGISVVQTAEGALTEVHDMLNRLFALAEQSNNGIYKQEEKEKLQDEVTQLVTEIDRIGDSTNFNGLKLLDGTLQDAPTPEITVTPPSYAGARTDVANVTGISMKWFSGADKSVKDAFNNAVNGKKISISALHTNADTEHGTAEENKVRVSFSNLSPYVLKAGTISKIDIKQDLIYKKTTATIDLDDTMKKGAEFKFTFMDQNENEVGSLFFTLSSIDSSTSYGFTETINMALVSDRTDANNAIESKPLGLQIGDSTNAYDKMYISIDSMKSNALGIDGLDVVNNAVDAMGKIRNAIESVSVQRGTLGAYQNRLDHTINNLSVMRENIQDAEATIRDTDMAEEMMKFTKNSLLVQSAQSMLAQANQIPQGVLSLLQ